MGGAVGSIQHIWDFDDLTFEELLEIFEGILEGSIDAIEKTDGLPIVWTWTGKEVLWARSSSDVRSGGFTSKEFKIAYATFPGFALLETGINFFENHVQPRLQNVPGFEGWIDSELFSPYSPQMVPSEIHAFIIHRAFSVEGNLDFDPFPLLRKTLGKVKAQSPDEKGENVQWSFFASADSPSVPRDSQTARNVVREIEQDLKDFLSQNSLALNRTINDWIQTEVLLQFKKDFPQVDETVLTLASFLAANPEAKDFSLNSRTLKGILKQEAPELISNLPTTKARAKEIKVLTLEPLKKKLKVLGAKFISELQPVLVSPENYSTIRAELRTGIEAAIEILETAEDEEMKQKAEKAAKHSAVVTGNEHLLAPYEGFVVSRGDNLMKVTGIFHDAGSIKKAGQTYKPTEIDWENADTVVSVFPMAAKPAHAGHWDMIEGISKIKPKNPVTGKPAKHIVKLVVSVSGRTRPGEISISGKQSLIYWMEFLRNHLPTNVELITAKDMFQQISREVFTARSQLNVFEVWIWSGDKDAGRFAEFTNIEGVSEPSQDKAEKALGRPTTNVSGTRMRQALAQDDMDFFMDHLPQPLSREEKEEIWVLFTEP
jgi:hypothetical protein